MAKVLEKIFSVKNDERKIHKVINIAGLKIKINKKAVDKMRSELTYMMDKNNPLYKSMIQDGYLRLLITHKCNAKCDFCGHWKWNKEKLEQELNHEFLFEQCEPLYRQIKMLSLSGGEITVFKEGLDFANFINKNYPHITIVTESNGINWNKSWQEAAQKGLWSVNFSVNGSNERIYHNSCWREEGFSVPYKKTRENILSYINLLKENNQSVFNPGISMVLNKDSVEDVYDFTKLALTLKARKITFFFDHEETCLNGYTKTKQFKYPDKCLPALRRLMEIERVLAKKICLYFRLWLPSEGIDEMQNEVDSIPINELRKKYSELLELAKDRDMLKEHNERNRIRKEHGKKILNFDEDFNATLRLIKVGNKQVCFAPWSMVDIMADAKLSFCSWARGTSELKYIYSEKGKIDWDKTLAAKPYILYRKKHYNEDFSGCQAVCPMNSSANPIVSVHKFGFDREVE